MVSRLTAVCEVVAWMTSVWSGSTTDQCVKWWHGWPTGGLTVKVSKLGLRADGHFAPSLPSLCLWRDGSNVNIVLVTIVIIFIVVITVFTVWYNCGDVWVNISAFSALMLSVGWQEGHSVCKNWVVTYWHGYLSGVRCKWFAYTPPSLAQ